MCRNIEGVVLTSVVLTRLDCSAFGIKGSSGEERVAFCCKLSLLWSGGRAPMTKHHLVFVVFESSSEIN
jgi:hypothetical protein